MVWRIEAVKLDRCDGWGVVLTHGNVIVCKDYWDGIIDIKKALRLPDYINIVMEEKNYE